MPSLSPLSTLRPWRTRDGTRGSVTTACPSAASVGASTIASRTASMNASCPNTATPASAPATIVSGSPIASRRRGTTYWRRSAREVDPRRVREEDDRQRRLGDPANGFAPDRRVEPAQDIRARHETAGDEHHRRSDHRPQKPPRDRRIREDEERDRDETRAAQPSVSAGEVLGQTTSRNEQRMHVHLLCPRMKTPGVDIGRASGSTIGYLRTPGAATPGTAAVIADLLIHSSPVLHALRPTRRWMGDEDIGLTGSQAKTTPQSVARHHPLRTNPSKRSNG